MVQNLSVPEVHPDLPAKIPHFGLYEPDGDDLADDELTLRVELNSWID